MKRYTDKCAISLFVASKYVEESLSLYMPARIGYRIYGVPFIVSPVWGSSYLLSTSRSSSYLIGAILLSTSVTPRYKYILYIRDLSLLIQKGLCAGIIIRVDT